MRILICLSMLQSAALGWLLLRPGETAPSATVPAAPVRAPAAQPIAADHEQLQAMIEAAVRASLHTDRALAKAGDTPASISPTVAPDVNLLRDEIVADMQSLTSAGVASREAIEALQIKIVQLPVRERRQMMNALMRAMNDGRIRGSLL